MTSTTQESPNKKSELHNFTLTKYRSGRRIKNITRILFFLRHRLTACRKINHFRLTLIIVPIYGTIFCCMLRFTKRKIRQYSAVYFLTVIKTSKNLVHYWFYLFPPCQ